MDINIVNNQIYHNLKIGSKSIDFNDYKCNMSEEKWKQFIIYSFLSLYKIKSDNINLEDIFNNLVNEKNVDCISYKEFNNLFYNALVGMNFMIDNINEEQYKALEDFLEKNKNVIGKCYTTDKEKCKKISLK